MAQVITVKLSRGDSSSSWGFRLQGGKDFATPLAVSRVNPNSLAEQGGLQTGDALLKVNGQNVDTLKHKDAQDVILRSGNNLEIVVQRGGMSIWKPTVTPINKPVLNNVNNHVEPVPLTKTSLAAKKQESRPIGSAHNVSAKPFAIGNGTVTAVLHKQYNSPANLYSMDTIAETLSQHTEILATGAKGINFMKEQKPINTESMVYRLVHEEDTCPKGADDDDERFLGTTSPNTQSHAFRRLQQVLDNGTEESPRSTPLRRIESPVSTGSPVPAPLRHVEAPVTKPADSKPADQAGNQSICGDCGRLIVGVFVRVGNKSLHAECFRCTTCGTSLKNVGYFNINDKLYCDIHARQVARFMAPSANLEPLTVSPGAMIPNDVPIVGAGVPAPAPVSAPPPPSMPSPVPRAGPLSPGLTCVSPIPFHPPKSVTPTAAPTAVPTYQQVHKPSTFVTHPQTAPFNVAHRPHPGGSKFIWPPPKQPVEPVLESNASPSVPTYRPPPGTQHVNFSSSSLFNTQSSSSSVSIQSSSAIASSAPAPSFTPQTPPAPAPAPAPMPAPASTTNMFNSQPPAAAPPVSTPKSPATTGTSPWHSTPTATKPSSGTPVMPSGSRPAPRRGRGTLNPQVSAGTRIPMCAACNGQIRGPFIVALNKTWCPDHFLCAYSHCRRPLMDLGFVEEQGKLYCENCYEAYLAPVCSKCNNRIKGDCLNALDKQWHPDCFICAYCHQPFGNNSFYLEDGLPYCEKDWNELFTTKCVGCGFPIEAGDRWVEALNNNYHSQCFKCTICHKNLEGQSFYAKGGRPFCKAHAR